MGSDGISLAMASRTDLCDLSAVDVAPSGCDHDRKPPICSEASSTLTPSMASKPSSPISILLEDILLMVFDDVIVSESVSWKRPRRRVTTGWRPESPPRNLASVSRAWRNIVLGCSMLWRYVVLTPMQPIHALRQHLRNASSVPIHLIVHQWPFQNSTPASGPYSILALTAQLHSILSLTDKEGVPLTPACDGIESISIHATGSSNFLNFVLQTWADQGSKFPALRRVTMDGNVSATWSRIYFFDDENAPALERLELSNVVIAFNMYTAPRATGLNLTTLVWAAPPHQHGSLIVSVACFHHIVSSFPNLINLELHGHVVGLEFAMLDKLEGNGITQLTHVRNLRINGMVFLNGTAALVLFYLLPSLRRLAVRGRACTGPLKERPVSLVLQALIRFPMIMDFPVVLEDLEELVLECVDRDPHETWRTWSSKEVMRWRQWRATTMGSKEVSLPRVRIEMLEGLSIDEHEHED